MERITIEAQNFFFLSFGADLARAKTALKINDNVPIIWAGADYGTNANFA